MYQVLLQYIYLRTTTNAECRLLIQSRMANVVSILRLPSYLEHSATTFDRHVNVIVQFLPREA